MSGEGAHSLDLIQRWFQSVITHPGGTEEGIQAQEAQELIELLPGEAEKVIERSIRLSSLERLSIYSNAYFARLIECLGNCFPVLKQALGATVFDSFAIEYLQQYPSCSYTLDHLGENFCGFLTDTRPDPKDGTDGVDWPDFLIDLSTLEWTIAKVFDGPGVEGQDLLRPESLQAFLPERFAESRIVPVVCLRLLAFRYPVSTYYTAVRRNAEKGLEPIPEPKAERVAVFRRDFVVRRYPLTEPQLALLEKLQAGATVGEAIAAASAGTDLDDNSLAGHLQAWFRFWAAEGFFASVSI